MCSKAYSERRRITYLFKWVCARRRLLCSAYLSFILGGNAFGVVTMNVRRRMLVRYRTRGLFQLTTRGRACVYFAVGGDR